MNTTYALLVVLAAVVIFGTVYILRPMAEPSLSTSPVSTSTPIDNTVKVPAETINPQEIKPISQKVAVTLKTSMGDIGLELDGTAAPFTVGNFVYLAQKDFYDNTTFHRVLPAFMIQGGDPLSRDPLSRARHGTGGPGYQFPDEANNRKIVRGAVAMANAGPGTNGSQFFIVVGQAFPHLDGKHTNFGTVTSGMEVVDKIVAVPRDANDNPTQPVIIQDVVIQGNLPAGLQVE
jgi:cyclophilin family peptidyl-prolyl cis-trans isomerase